MATLYITEYSSMGTSGVGAGMPIAMSPAVASQTLAISGTAALSALFNTATRFIRVHTDAICSIAISTAPVAVTTNKRMAANQTEYFGVIGGTHKISVISNA